MIEQDLLLIERYLDNALKEEEVVAFQNRLKSDPDFAATVELEKDLRSGIEAFGNLKLKEELQQIHQEEMEKDSAKIIPLYQQKWFRIAAAFVGIGVAIWLFFNLNETTPESLYAKYAVHEINLIEMGRDDDILGKVQQLIDQEKYEEALPLLNEYLRQYPDEHNILLTKGISLLETNNYSEALALFNALRQIPLVKDEGIWYAALTLLKEHKIEACRNLLQQIPDTSARKASAIQLVKDLNDL